VRQVFLFNSDTVPDFQNEDGFPVSEKLWSELITVFASCRKETSDVLRIPAAEALSFLSGFYSRYELSQPQRRILRRLEQILGALSPQQAVGFTAAEVSEHRSRRFSKKG
jgi:sulfur relay (sulfurtransferase) DsrC/TusE family protein